MRLDLIYIVLFAVALPLWGYFVDWPAFRRLLEVDPVGARHRLWTGSSLYPWLLVAIGAGLWIANDRSWASLGFSVPEGWRLWTAIALVVLIAAYQVYAIAAVARSAEVRASVLQKDTLTVVLPHTRGELSRWSFVAVTAGFCEEFLYRGYFIWVFAQWLGWWGAAALSIPCFALVHVYQGWKGVLQTGIVGVVFTLIVAMCQSLWPAIAVHVIVDLGAGVIAWLALRGNR
jgi:membrane protease YdiL (CAAX protease family)